MKFTIAHTHTRVREGPNEGGEKRDRKKTSPEQNTVEPGYKDIVYMTPSL
jgi:hypothetical protein